MLLRALAISLLLLIIAVDSGAFREAFVTPSSGDQVAHIVSTGILCVAIFAVAWFSIWCIGPKSGKNALLVGYTGSADDRL